MPKSEKGNNSVKYSQNFTKSLSGHLHHVPKLFDAIILAEAVLQIFVDKVALLQSQSRKREIIQSYIYGILSKVNLGKNL